MTRQSVKNQVYLMFNVKTGDDKLVSGRSIFLQEGHGNLSNGGDIKITGDNTSD